MCVRCVRGVCEVCVRCVSEVDNVIWLKVFMVHETFYLSFDNSTEECACI